MRRHRANRRAAAPQRRARVRMLARLRRAATGARGGKKFAADVRPVRAESLASRDADARANEDEEEIIVRWRRGAKVVTSAPAVRVERVDGKLRAVWDDGDRSARVACVVTLFERQGGSGIRFERKAFAVEALARGGDGGWIALGRGTIDFAEHARVGDDGWSRVSISLTGGGVIVVDVRCAWLGERAAEEDAMTNLSCVSALSSAATDATPPPSGECEQDLSGFPVIPQSLLSPVAESVSPIVARQLERREAAARAETEAQCARVNELEVEIALIRNELEVSTLALAAQKRDSVREIAESRAEAEAARSAKNVAIARALADIDAIEKEKNAAVMRNKEYEFQLEALRRSIRERDAGISPQNKENESKTAHESALQLERAEHVKTIERYKTQLDAADAQLNSLLRDHRNEKASFERELELQVKLRTETERALEQELEASHAECDELRQQFQNLVAETTALSSALKRTADEQKKTQIDMARAECAQAKCDLRAVTEELADVRKVLDSHVNELIACKLAAAEMQQTQLKLRRELFRAREKALNYAVHATRMESRVYSR